ncbi:hypothetical protein V8D89_001375 [Ganoderma adspersum]
MPSHTDIDTLIASLHPHVAQCYCGNALQAGRSLRPGIANVALQEVCDSLVILFGLHPGCDAAAATIQTEESTTTSLFVCPSPIVPHDFEDNVKHWVDQFSAIRKEYTGDTSRDSNGEPSPSMRTQFIITTYRLCYPAMRQHTMGDEFGIWEMLYNDAREQTVDEPLASELQQLAELAERFAQFISSRETLDEGEDEDTLRFHELCVALYRALNSERVKKFVEQYLYPEGVLFILVYLCLPHALSILLSDSSEYLLPTFHDQWSITVLDPVRGARQFSTPVTVARFQECFGNVPNIDWEEAMKAYRKVVLNTEDYGKGLEWDAEKSLLSTAGVVTAHPETTLIQFLLEGSRVEGEVYIACSRLPCYASVRYVEAVNKVVKPTFTLRTTNPDWCRLDVAEPWILPQATSRVVISTLRTEMLWDLAFLLSKWRHNPFQDSEEEYDDDDNDENDDGYDDDDELCQSDTGEDTYEE